MQYFKEVMTPIGKHVVRFRTMLTGPEREQVEAAQMQFVETTDGREFKIKDMKAIKFAQKHELLKVSIVSIDNDETDCFARLQKMFSPDYEFVHQSILEEQKKASGLISTPSS